MKNVGKNLGEGLVYLGILFTFVVMKDEIFKWMYANKGVFRAVQARRFPGMEFEDNFADLIFKVNRLIGEDKLKYDGRGLNTYLTHIWTNMLIDVKRKEARGLRGVVFGSSDSQERYFSRIPDAPGADQLPTVDSLLELVAGDRRLDVFRDHLFLRLSGRDLAIKHGLRENTVQTHLYNVKKKIKKRAHEQGLTRLD